MLRTLHRRRRALPAPAFEALRTALLESPLVGASTLSGAFSSSRGFAVTFRGEPGRQKVLERFPTLAPHLDLILGAPAVRALTPWWRRSLTRVPNAWYLNVLLVGAGGTVAKHLDVTLREASGVATTTPELVSVLYLLVPPAKGGELVLATSRTLASVIFPEENMRVHFRGDLFHEVRAFEGDGLRASLVLEQYCFTPEALERLPDFQLDSRAGFGAFLKHHATAPEKKTFELEP
jgi:hypothetical protein